MNQNITKSDIEHRLDQAFKLCLTSQYEFIPNSESRLRTIRSIYYALLDLTDQEQQKLRKLYNLVPLEPRLNN